MAHDSNKSKVLCVVAKGVYWPIRVGVIVVGGAGILICVVSLLRSLIIAVSQTPWAVAKEAGRIALIAGGLLAIVIGLMEAYIWADGYRKDC